MEELDHKAIGFRIRKQRIIKHMSQYELAQKVGIAPAFLAYIELGKKGFSLSNLNRFCSVLDVTAAELLDGPREENLERKYAVLTELLDCYPEGQLEEAEKLLRFFLISHDPEKGSI